MKAKERYDLIWKQICKKMQDFNWKNMTLSMEHSRGHCSGESWYGENLLTNDDYLHITPIEKSGREVNGCVSFSAAHECGVGFYKTYEEFESILNEWIKMCSGKSDDTNEKEIEEKKMENQITSVIAGLADAFEQEAYDDYVKNHKDNINIDLDNFNKWELHLYESQTPMEQYIKEWFRNKGVTDRNNLEKLVFIYQNYHFLKANVERLVDLGRGCRADKSSHVLKSYIRYLSNEQKTVFYGYGHSEHKYWHPDFGDVDLWYDFVDALIDLYYGKTNTYMQLYVVLISLKNEVLKEIEKDNEMFRNYIPVYMEIIEKHKDEFDADLYHKLTKTNYRSIIISELFPNVKNGTITEEMVIEMVKEMKGSVVRNEK